MTVETQTVETLSELLNTGDEVDRCYASRALGVLRANSATPILIERLKDEDIDVCVDAAEALGKIGAKESVPALLESLENDHSGEICAVVVESLGKIGGSDVHEALLKVAIERPENVEWDDDWDTWWNIQLEAIKALGNFAAEEAVEPLIGIIDDDSHQDIEGDILQALSKIPGKGIDALIERLQNQEGLPQYRRRAARTLGGVDSGKAIKALGRALKDEESEVRTEAALALAKSGAEKYLSILILMLRDPSEDVRSASAKACISLAEQGASTDVLEKELLPMLTDPSSQVRDTLFNILAAVTTTDSLSDESFAAVLKSIDDKSAETASSACKLLAKNNNPKAIPALLDLLNEPDGHPMVRREAALAIGKLGEISADSIDGLTRAVGDRQQAVRFGALSALMALETDGEMLTSSDEKEPEIARPLDIIIAAVKGEITLNAKNAKEKAGKESVTATDETVEQDGDNGNTAEEQAAGQVVDFDPDAMKPSNDKPDEPTKEAFSERVASTIKLPETPARIVEEGEVKSAMSTLDAIAMDNVEATLNQANRENDEPEFDEETQEYIDVVEENKELMRRIKHKKRITAEQDVRHLGVRILAKSEDESAIAALILALNDDDSLLRREATEAIGEIGLKRKHIPQLMDTIGTIITQLSVGDLEQRVTSAQTLGNLGNRAAIIPLMEALKDPEVNVRIQAMDALSNLIVCGSDVKEADHMVVRNVPPLSVSRKILPCLDDEEIGVRVAAARALAKIQGVLSDETFRNKVVEKIIANAILGGGEEARIIGRVLGTLGQKTIIAEKLLSQLKQTENSIKRSVYIEMLEELLNPNQAKPEQAA